ncbi:restriction endonuclease [Clostridium perfringens]|uniref:restriction endonuclease subunit S n=1 Tax=Clostridium perfringens TaxID=1502 RepID=UPI0013E28AC2|nr:restriction endonuclease subunit S [Clostridium perfringens]NGU46130.1 restriction endonuclease [Clostridium perfringens]NGU71871.1 restriction endonuclease [Clostridium perfringens]
MNYVNLKEYIEILESGKRPKGGATDEGVPSLGGEHINSFGGFNLEKNKLRYVPTEYFNKLQKGIVQGNDILIVKDGATTGKVGYVDENFTLKECCINEHLFLLRTRSELNSKYLFYFLYSELGQYQVLKDFRGATVGGISRKFIEMPIYLPSYSEQLRIVEILDNIKALIEKRKSQIEELDLLVKSKFIEMFGDPITNSKEWNTFELREGIKEIKYGTSKPPIFSEEGIPFVRATNIKFGRIIENDMKYISEYEAEKIEKCKLSLGDTIIVRSGANTGDNAFVSEEYVGSYGGYDIIVKLNEKINYIFLNALLNSIYRETIIQPLTRRAGQPHLNSEQIQSLVIYNPPIELQNQFADFVKQVDKLKFEMEKSLKELENNFNSLMNKAFKGELF